MSHITPESLRNAMIFFGVLYFIYDAIKYMPMVQQDFSGNRPLSTTQYWMLAFSRGGFLIVLAFIVYVCLK